MHRALRKRATGPIKRIGAEGLIAARGALHLPAAGAAEGLVYQFVLQKPRRGLWAWSCRQRGPARFTAAATGTRSRGHDVEPLCSKRDGIQLDREAVTISWKINYPRFYLC